MVGLRINETLETGAVRKPHLPFSRLVGAVFNSAYAVWLEIAPTVGESVYLLEFTIVERTHYCSKRALTRGAPTSPSDIWRVTQRLGIRRFRQSV